MRLTKQELAAVKKELRELDPQGAIFLYGSRADDARRGGDIDVYFEPTLKIELKSALMAEWRISSACGTKVDLLIRNPGQAVEPIHSVARNGIAL